MLRGVKILLLVLGMLCFSKSSYSQQSVTVNYTVPVDMATLNKNYKKEANYYYPTEGVGLSHILLKQIFKNTNIKYNYNVYNSYNEALQASMLYNSSKVLDFIIGITFDEKNNKYLNYIPIPLYQDYLVVVVAKSSYPAGLTPSKNIAEMIAGLSVDNTPLSITGLNFEEKNYGEFKLEKTVSEAMEKVFRTNAFLVAPWDFVAEYFDKNKMSPNVKTLKVFQYPKNTLSYFIAINKNAPFKEVIIDGNKISLYNFIEQSLQLLVNNGELKKIIEETKRI